MLLAMPFPRRIDTDAITESARAILEAGGPEALTMRALARKLGVKAPSLYAYVENRDDLLRLLVAAGLQDLGTRLSAAAEEEPRDPSRRLVCLARAYIEFAGSAPQVFALMLGPGPPESRASPELERATSAPVVQSAVELAGPGRGEVLAQAVWSLVHGYSVLNLADRFKLNPDPRAAFFDGLDLLLRGAVASARPGA